VEMCSATHSVNRSFKSAEFVNEDYRRKGINEP